MYKVIIKIHKEVSVKEFPFVDHANFKENYGILEKIKIPESSKTKHSPYSKFKAQFVCNINIFHH
jgi:hypothetical protein